MSPAARSRPKTLPGSTGTTQLRGNGEEVAGDERRCAPAGASCHRDAPATAFLLELQHHLATNLGVVVHVIASTAPMRAKLTCHSLCGPNARKRNAALWPISALSHQMSGAALSWKLLEQRGQGTAIRWCANVISQVFGDDLDANEIKALEDLKTLDVASTTVAECIAKSRSFSPAIIELGRLRASHGPPPAGPCRAVLHSRCRP